MNALAESYSQSIVQKVLRQLRGMLEEVLEQDLVGKNPARRVKMPNTRRPCGRFLMASRLRLPSSPSRLASLASSSRIFVAAAFPNQCHCATIRNGPSSNSQRTPRV